MPSSSQPPPVGPRLVGRGFHARVYAVVRTIPPGRVATYGQIARILGARQIARHVGFALAAATWPEHDPVPWHRVINARGEISLAQPQRQRQRLLREGIQFNLRGRINLAHFGWSGTPDSDALDGPPSTYPSSG